MKFLRSTQKKRGNANASTTSALSTVDCDQNSKELVANMTNEEEGCQEDASQNVAASLQKNKTLETAMSDTESTASSSKFSSLDDEFYGLVAHHHDNEHKHLGDEHKRYTYNLCQFLDKTFDNKANKTILLSETQMKQIRRSIAADYTEILLDENDVTRHGVEIHLRCASHVLDQFSSSQEMILQTKMAATALEMLFLALEDYIFPRVVDQLYPKSDLTPDVTAMAITWIYKLESDIERLAANLTMRKEWSEERQNLFDHYLDRAVRHKMTILLQEVLKLHSVDDIRRDVDGYLVTGLPEQVTYIYNQQLKVASECLPDHYKEDVLITCNEELSSMISDWTLRISYEWREMGSPYFCAIINDTSRLMEYCDERHEQYLTRPELVETGHIVTRDIVDFSLHATRYLCERVMRDLREPEPILNSVGDAEWESLNGYSVVDRTIATFKDFFVDFEGWLIRDYFFPKVLKNCFDLALQTYLESFFANTMVRGIHDPSAVAEELEKDYLRFVVYFNGEHFMEYHGRGGFYSQKMINDRLRVLQHMSALVDPTNVPSNLSFEIQEILAHFGQKENGGPAVLHLVGLRYPRRATDSMQWLKQIAKAKKELANRDKADTPTFLCTLPDVRNSKMLRKIRPPPRSEIPREISKGSRPFAESTVRLLHLPNRFAYTATSVNVAPVAALLDPVRQYAQRQWHEHAVDDKLPTEYHVVDAMDLDEDRQVEDDYESEGETENEFYFEGRVLAEF